MSRYVTTPIYYPNDIPHIGTAYPTLAADIYARWAKLEGEDVFFLTGTDEHGKKIEDVALNRGMAPQAFVDDLAHEFKTAFAELEIEYSRFIRTTEPDHAQVVQALLEKIQRNGDIYAGTYSGLYCVDCEAYYAENDLQNGDCPFHHKPVSELHEDCYYFRLSNYQEKLLAYFEANPGFVRPEARRNEVLSFVRSGLDDLCISRKTLRWGIPIPFDVEHTTYVWFDALINYLTGIQYLDDPGTFERYWPSATHIIGKDILRFHAVIWPAMLMSADLQPPRRIFAHGFWTVNGRKFSKSLGNVIRPSHLIAAYGLDPLRYYMFRETTFGSDGDFSEANLVERNNRELAQGLGNLLHRATSMITKYRKGVVPLPGPPGTREEDLAARAHTTVEAAASFVHALNFSAALEEIWGLIRALNVYVNTSEPWRLAKDGHHTDLDTSLSSLAEGLRFLSSLVAPFMPGTGRRITERLGLAELPAFSGLTWGSSLAGSSVHHGSPLFIVLEPPVVHVPRPVAVDADPAIAGHGIHFAVAQLTSLRIPRETKRVELRKREVEDEVRRKGRDWMKDWPPAAGYQELYAQLGKAPGTIKSPVEMLSEYVFDSELGRLPQINAVVDLYNVLSLRTGLSIGTHDRDKITGGIRLAVASAPVPYRPLGSAVAVNVEIGEYYWTDDANVLCRLDIKQGEATKVDEFTQHVVLIVQGHPKIPASKVLSETRRLCKDMVEICGGEFEIVGENCE